MEELVSIVVPVYNVEDWLDRCVESLVKQTYRNIEIILVNDGTKDNSRALMSAWAEKDERVVCIDKVNGGLSDARNEGMKHVHGSMVAFIDSDDFIDEHMIERMLASHHEHGSDVVVCDMKYLYDTGEEKFASGGAFTVGKVADQPSLMTINNSACNKLFSTTLFDDVKFPVGKYYEDLALIPIVLYKAECISKVDEPFYVYYQRTGSIAHSANKKIFHIYDAIAGDIDYVKAHGNEAEVLKELHHFYIIHGLDLTTLRIKDFDDKAIRVEYLKENMEHLRKHYPDYKKDEAYKNASLKKKVIYALMGMGMYKLVLSIYDR
ncbi:MAG: glycosyltransferase family 2 protein [Erysipelotrichaceae bacterium]|nr:glycosyltransferase family 2 protein [Erysipelotrichaceae bacterium]